jgi:hypothetical protein
MQSISATGFQSYAAPEPDVKTEAKLPTAAHIFRHRTSIVRGGLVIETSDCFKDLREFTC